MDEEIFKSTSQEVGSFRDFQGSDAMDSGQRRLVDSTQSVPVVQFVSDELSEVFGNQGSGAWPQNDNMNRGARTALVDHLSSNLALISEYQCGTYFPQSPFDGERGEQENILPEPIPLHLVSDFGRQTSCLFQELIGRQNLFPLERLCNLPKAISLPENFQNVGGRSVAPNTVADIYPMEIGDIGPQQQQNGFSLSSLFGCTRYQRETGEILHLVSASEPQMIETRAETYLDERDQAKRSKSILLCNFANERVCKDNPISPQSLPSNPEVSSNQLHSDGLKANTQGAVPPNQPSEQRGRACRGQATDPHSISERIRRVKISERLGTLQSLVPDSNKTDKASILDEIIDYVKLLQLQVFTMSKIRCHGVGANASFITKFKPEVSQNIASAGGCSQDMDMAEKMSVKLLKEDFNAGAEYLKDHGICVIRIPELKQVSDTVTALTNTYPLTKGIQKGKQARDL